MRVKKGTKRGVCINTQPPCDEQEGTVCFFLQKGKWEERKVNGQQNRVFGLNKKKKKKRGRGQVKNVGILCV